MPDPHTLVRWDGRKWPDHPHWQFNMPWLGEDDHGAWLSVPSGTVVQRGDDAPRILEHGFVSLVLTIDEDEFAENQVRFAYPPELVDRARRTAAAVATLLRRRSEPFGSAAQRWMDAADLGPAPARD